MRRVGDLSSLRAVVTGGTRGIGKGIAAALAEAGADVVILGRDVQAGTEAAASMAGHSGRVTFHGADLGDSGAIERAIRVARERLGGIDILCCNAGIYPQGDIADIADAELEEVLSINLVSNFRIVRSALPDLRASQTGRVVLTSSITGPITGMAGFTAYAASKAGQLGFMRSAAVELAPYGITVNAVLPGNIVTEGLEGLGDDYRLSMLRSIPVGRLGSVKDVGEAVVYLCGTTAGFVTGQALVIDGGQTLPEALPG